MDISVKADLHLQPLSLQILIYFMTILDFWSDKTQFMIKVVIEFYQMASEKFWLKI